MYRKCLKSNRQKKNTAKKNNKSMVILRLPVAHLEMNTVELIWANVKGEVVRKNKTLKMKDVKRRWKKPWQTLQWKNG